MGIPKGEPIKLKKASIGKKEWSYFVDSLCQGYKVYGPVCKETEYVFGPINKAAELELDYRTTILPPKKLLHQPFETMFHYTIDGGIIEEEKPKEKQIILGIHPCDVHAIRVLDKAYIDEYPDPYYQQKRANTIIIAMNCSTIGENCFCGILGTGPVLDNEYDVLITDLGDEYLLEAGSEVGEEIIKNGALADASESALAEKQNKVESLMKKVPQPIPSEGVSKLLELNFHHPIWDKLAKECLACGSCTMVCPTCFLL